MFVFRDEFKQKSVITITSCNYLFRGSTLTCMLTQIDKTCKLFLLFMHVIYCQRSSEREIDSLQLLTAKKEFLIDITEANTVS